MRCIISSSPQYQYRVIFTYDILPHAQERYYRFVRSVWVPELQGMGVELIDVFHVLWGEHPIRQTEFGAYSLDTLRDMFENNRYLELEAKLQEYTKNYSRKVIPYAEGFQL